MAPALAALLCACSSRPSLPPLPDFRLEGFQPSVRDQLDKALRAVKASPNDDAVNGRLGMVLHAHAQYAAARVMYQRARLLDPEDFSWPYYLSHVEDSMGNRSAALEALDAAARINAAYPPLRLRRAEILLDQGRLEESAALYAKLTTAQPESAAAWYGLGRVRLALGDAAGAVDPLQKACELFPRYGAAHYALAQALRKLGREEEAAPHLAQSEKHKTAAPPPGDSLLSELTKLSRSAGDLLRAAKAAEEQGRLDEAEALSRSALELDPKSAQAHINLISLCGRRGRLEEAAEHYRRAVELNPDHADAHYNYGVLLFQEKRFADAKDAFEKAIRANPYFAAAHNNLGYLLESEGRTSEALKHYRAAVDNEPGYRLAHFHLGRLLANQRRYAEAIEHLRKTLSPEDSSTPGYLYALGAAYGRSGDRSTSINLMRRARQKAEALGQTGLATTIDKDLRTLGAP